jgi:effector-binding domain-containing protein
MHGSVVGYQLIESPARRTAVVRASVERSELSTFCSHALRAVLAKMESQGTVPGGEPFAYYHGTLDGTVEVEAGFPTLDRFTASGNVLESELPGGKTVTGIHLGPYDARGNTYATMSAWAIAHGLQPTGDMWEVYLTDPEREPDPDHWRVGVFLPVQ